MKTPFKLKFLFRKTFYRYWYYKLKRERPWTVIFFDWPTFLLIGAVFLAGLYLLFPGKVQLSIPNKDGIVYVLESILRNLSLFVGISFSFLLLSFNIFYRYFGRFVFIGFFKNRSARVYLTLIICTISLLIYSITYTRDLTETNRYTEFLYFLCLSLAATCFFGIFPSLISLLQNAQSRDNIKKIFDELNENWLIKEWEARVYDKSMHAFYQKDPITILTEIGTAAIKEFDNKTIGVITSTCPEFFKKNIEEVEKKKQGIDNTTLYQEFNLMLSNLMPLSLKERNEVASNMIISSRFKIEELVLNNLDVEGFDAFNDHDKKYRHWTLTFHLADYIERALQFNEDAVVERIIDRYREFAAKSISILFPKKFTYSKAKHFEATQETYMVIEPMTKLSDMITKLVLYKKPHLFQPVFRSLISLQEAAMKQSIDDAAKCFLLGIISNYRISMFEAYAGMEEVKHISYLNFPFQTTSYVYEQTKCKIPHLAALSVMDMLLSTGKLNLIVINSMKAEMMGFVKLASVDEGAMSLLRSTINKFVNLAQTIKPTDTDYRKDIYLKLHQYLGYFTSYRPELFEKDPALGELFSEAGSRFEHKELFEKELLEKGYVGDIRII